jgi:hypothetical protein
MASSEQVTLLWHGAAHYHILHKDVRIVIDPLFTRLPGDVPHLPVTKDDVKGIDCLLLTHGHLDHSSDFPYLVAKHNPLTYAPQACLHDIFKRDGDCPKNYGPRSVGRRFGTVPRASEFDRSRNQALEKLKGTSFEVADISITPYQIGTEEVDFWFIREMFLRPWKHRKPTALADGLRWLVHHLFGNCFAFLFSLPPDGKTMLYFGNLTSRVDELHSIKRVDVLAIPFCPANNHWLRDTQFLINRFRPGVALIHHFDNFMNPFTLYRYMNLDDYRAAIMQHCPDANLFFSKFYKMISLPEILGQKVGR